MIIAALGLSFFLKGSVEKPFPSALSNEPVNIYGLIITPQQMIIITFTLVFLAVLTVFFAFTKLGKSMRAVCSNKGASSLMG